MLPNLSVRVAVLFVGVLGCGARSQVVALDGSDGVTEEDGSAGDVHDGGESRIDAAQDSSVEIDAGPRDPACPVGHVGRADSGIQWYVYFGVVDLAASDHVIFRFSILPASGLTLVGGDDQRGATEFQTYFERGVVDGYYPIRGDDVTYVENVWNLVEADFSIAGQDGTFTINGVRSLPRSMPDAGVTGVRSYRMHVSDGGTAYIDSLTVRIVHAGGDEEMLLEEDFEFVEPPASSSEVPDSVDRPPGVALPPGC